MRQQLITSLVAIVSELCPDVNPSELDRRFTEALSSWHVERTGTEVAVAEPFPRAARDYLTSRAIEGLSKHTLALYHRTLVRFFDDIRLDLPHVDATAVKLWIYRLQQSGLTDTTVRLYAGIVRTFLAWCADNDILQKNPARQVPAPKAERHYKTPLTREELTAVRDACTTDRERVVVELLYSTGCRVGELVTTSVPDIHLDSGIIRMRNWKGRRDKTCFISETCSFWLRRWLPTLGASPVIVPSRKGGRQLSISGLERMLAGIGARAGLSQKLTPHLLRHTLATDVVSRGGSLADAQKLLDHASPSTTLIYAKLSERQLQETHRRCAA